MLHLLYVYEGNPGGKHVSFVSHLSANGVVKEYVLEQEIPHLVFEPPEHNNPSVWVYDYIQDSVVYFFISPIE